MAIDMNEAQVRTLDQVRQVLEGTQALEFRRAEDDAGRYGWIEAVLRRFEYRRLPRGDRAPVLAYLQRLSGYSRAQVTRLVSRWVSGKGRGSAFAVSGYHSVARNLRRIRAAYRAPAVLLARHHVRKSGTLH